MIFVCFIFLLTAEFAYGVSLSPCTPDGYMEVEEDNSNNVFTCSGFQYIADELYWIKDTIYIGYCPAPAQGSINNTCKQFEFEGIMNMVRTEWNSSTLTINPVGQSNTSLLETGYMRCRVRLNGMPSCILDYVVKPSDVRCIVKLDRWTVAMNCTINRMRSSNDRYECTWFQQRDDLPKQSLANITMTTTGEKNKSGTCFKTIDLPTVEGSYTFWMYTLLGDTHHPAHTIRIFRPSYPTNISCSPSGYVPENTNITCTCSTSQTGNPPGRLVWRSGITGNINTVINTADYGEKTLQMSQALQRQDHGVKKFQCGIDWAEQIYMLSDEKSVQVGYPPTQAVLKINSQQNDVTVGEGERVVLECRGEGGRPNSTSLTIKDNNDKEVAAVSGTGLYFTLSNVMCENSGIFTCSAGNGMGPEVITQRALFVNCQPRDSTLLPPINDGFTTVTFNLIAYPVPNDITFTFLGQSENGNGQSIGDDITLTGTCVRGNKLYTAFCSVTVGYMIPSAAGFYNVTVKNSVGQMSLSLKVNFKIFEEPPPPSLTEVLVGVFGLTSIVLIVTNVVLLVCICRRKVLSAEKRSEATPDDKPKAKPNSPACDEYESIEITRNNISIVESSGPYSSLQMSEVGLKSPYAQLE